MEEVQGQKEALNERLCANNEAIGRVQAEINTACSDSNKPGQLLHVRYRIAGNFRGRKLSQIGRKGAFRGNSMLKLVA